MGCHIDWDIGLAPTGSPCYSEEILLSCIQLLLLRKQVPTHICRLQLELFQILKKKSLKSSHRYNKFGATFQKIFCCLQCHGVRSTNLSHLGKVSFCFLHLLSSLMSIFVLEPFGVNYFIFATITFVCNLGCWNLGTLFLMSPTLIFPNLFLLYNNQWLSTFISNGLVCRLRFNNCYSSGVSFLYESFCHVRNHKLSWLDN